MASPLAAEAISARRKGAIEKALEDGFTPFRSSGGKGSSVQEGAKRLGENVSSLMSWLRTQEERAAAGKSNWLPDWTRFRAADATGSVARQPPAKARRWLLTSAQDDTPVHAAFWRNLLAYAEHIGAEIRVGGFTYQKGLFEDHAARTAVFATEVQPYMAHERIECGPVLFCAEMNVLPTAARPLAGLETYSAGRWAVFPHAKVQLVSVPTITGAGAALLMTTGACTVPNYVAKKAGLVAEFHHIIGATIVEIDAGGRQFCRQINAAEDGSFQDMDVRVDAGRVTAGHRIEAITWGDIHREKLDPVVAMGGWGFDAELGRCTSRDNMLDQLRPRHQVFHDLLDFEARNHHRRGDHQFRFRMLCEGTDSVEAAMRSVVQFVRETSREFCTTVIAPSNHNDAYPKWLREADFREDAVNALFWLRSTTAVYEALDQGLKDFDVFRWALTELDPGRMADVVFPSRNGSYVICQGAGGIECALHGDQGPNGARGTPNNLRRVAVRMNIGHGHSAAIADGVYAAGLSGYLDQDYNSGPSSWSHSHVVTYPNGKRSIVTMQEGRWRA